jgi:hypothetical protein
MGFSVRGLKDRGLRPGAKLLLHLVPLRHIAQGLVDDGLRTLLHVPLWQSEGGRQ